MPAIAAPNGEFLIFYSTDVAVIRQVEYPPQYNKLSATLLSIFVCWEIDR
jgi:hypothetical protein